MEFSHVRRHRLSLVVVDECDPEKITKIVLPGRCGAKSPKCPLNAFFVPQMGSVCR